ncbi:hypothetical protein ESOMN_v1c01280 [Williamsoniiplasma somnilux]|uniref:Uncharacterized protein n=1 Tax=Williamsoniiplasma somnilux TaxID=215578 RepID=A0A2K8P0U0_9MOLU|nr:hypothetical protein [Williamsoniiplasma somnilux]ATZ18513.1 hypothetical protein ESOMN_v1c01280 [Williamsoniiplasma somnilux]
MLFIYNQNILVEIKELEKNHFLIGDTIYDNLPQSLIDDAFNLSNWNRALKFKTIETTTKILKNGFFIIKFEVYYDYANSKIVTISKNQFHQKVLEQNLFKNDFLQTVFDFRNRNKQNYQTKTLQQNFFDKNFVEVINEINLDLNRCLINDDFETKNNKFKVLFKMGTKFKIEQNELSQTIYTLPFSDSNLTLIDFKTNKIYIKGQFSWKYNLNLDLVYEDKILINDLKTLLVNNIVEHTDVKFKNWHLFNATYDPKYLVDEIAFLSTNNFDVINNYLKALFNEMRINFYSSLYQNQEVKNALALTAKTPEEKTTLITEINRYSVFTTLDKNSLKHS